MRSLSSGVVLFFSLAFACESEKPKAEPAPAPAPEPSAATAATPDPVRSAAPAAPAKSAIPAPADVAEAPRDAARTKSGLASKVLAKGSGKQKPKPSDQVRVFYAGWTKDGRMFDATTAGEKPTSFGVSKVIPGWTEGLQLMVEGEKRRLWIPAKLAYGERPAMVGAPAGDLVFDVELVEIAKPPETPKDLRSPPKDATKTESGLVYKILTKGKGAAKPMAANTVTVHYSGWTKDGQLFDSSIVNGAPISLPLTAVIKGWTEALQLMVVGDKARLWIPSALAYGDSPARKGAPAGDLVFDVELIAIR